MLPRHPIRRVFCAGEVLDPRTSSALQQIRRHLDGVLGLREVRPEMDRHAPAIVPRPQCSGVPRDVGCGLTVCEGRREVDSGADVSQHFVVFWSFTVAWTKGGGGGKSKAVSDRVLRCLMSSRFLVCMFGIFPPAPRRYPPPPYDNPPPLQYAGNSRSHNPFS